MQRPLVSVSTVRVSLTVTMKQRTDFGAWALCSTSVPRFAGGTSTIVRGCLSRECLC
jgi:hypothetical protein